MIEFTEAEKADLERSFARWWAAHKNLQPSGRLATMVVGMTKAIAKEAWLESARQYFEFDKHLYVKGDQRPGA